MHFQPSTHSKGKTEVSLLSILLNFLFEYFTTFYQQPNAFYQQPNGGRLIVRGQSMGM
jgi:hypothetical protein